MGGRDYRTEGVYARDYRTAGLGAADGDILVTPTPAVLTLTGVDPAVTGGVSTETITPTPAVLSLSGVDPVVYESGSFTVTPSPAVLILSGSNPSVEGGNVAAELEYPRSLYWRF
jgi:hypothetical protein